MSHKVLLTYTGRYDIMLTRLFHNGIADNNNRGLYPPQNHTKKMSTDTTVLTSSTTTSTTAAPLEIKEIILRDNFSLDDAEAVRLLDQRAWSSGKFDFTGAARRFVETLMSQGTPTECDKYWDSQGKLGVGTGGGRFGQIGEYACELVAQHLSTDTTDLVEDESLRLLRDEIISRARDRKPGMLTLPKILQKMHHRVSKDETGNRWLLSWTIGHLTTVHKGLIVTYQTADGEKTLLEIFEKMADDGKGTSATGKKGKKAKKVEFPEEKARETLRGWVVQSQEDQNESCLELSSLVASMFRTKATETPVEDIILEVEFIIRNCYEYQVAFNQAIEESKTGTTYQVKERGADREPESEFSFLVLETNNDLVIPAGQTKDGGNHALVLLRNERGNVVFKLGSWMRRTSLKRLATMVEILEMKSCGRPVNRVKISQLGQPGKLYNADHWEYNDYSQVLSNGFAKSNVASARCSLKDLIVAAHSAFHYQMYFSWLRKRGVPIGGGKRTARPLASVGAAITSAQAVSPAPADEKTPPAK